MDSPQTLVYGRSTRRLKPSPKRRSATGPDGSAELLLERYRLIRRLGAGGFGVVWEAHDELLGREVALKRISLPAAVDRERAKREALVSARLAHPAIVALYEAHSEQDEFYLVSELVRGQTLGQLMAVDELSDRQILDIGVSLAEALEHAHDQGVIHRDVKPQNVLIAEQPELSVKLADFGGAHMAGAAALTRTGDVLGTLAYMAPEQCEGSKVDTSADLYSLALVLYEAFSGVNPVRGETPAATVRRIGKTIAPLGRYRRDLPGGLTRAIDRALAVRRNERGTLWQLREALQETLSAHSSPGKGGVLEPIRTRQLPAAHPLSSTFAGTEAQYSSDGSNRRWYELPRACWWICAVGVILWQALNGHSGVALLLAAAAFALLALPRHGGPGWSTAALAPALGLIGLAGMFTGVAGLRSSWRARVALGALGYWWLTLGEPLTGRRLWLGSPAGTPARAVWESSLQSAATHVLYPLLTPGVLFGAGLWACGSMLLPWLVRGRNFAVDGVLVSMWAAALIAAQPLLDSGLPTRAAAPVPRGLTISTILAGVLVVGARAMRGPV